MTHDVTRVEAVVNRGPSISPLQGRRRRHTVSHHWHWQKFSIFSLINESGCWYDICERLLFSNDIKKYKAKTFATLTEPFRAGIDFWKYSNCRKCCILRTTESFSSSASAATLPTQTNSPVSCSRCKGGWSHWRCLSYNNGDWVTRSAAYVKLSHVIRVALEVKKVVAPAFTYCGRRLRRKHEHQEQSQPQVLVNTWHGSKDRRDQFPIVWSGKNPLSSLQDLYRHIIRQATIR